MTTLVWARVIMHSFPTSQQLQCISSYSTSAATAYQQLQYISSYSTSAATVHLQLQYVSGFMQYSTSARAWQALGAKLVQQLEAEGRKPFLIPVGGSNALGTWYVLF